VSDNKTVIRRCHKVRITFKYRAKAFKSFTFKEVLDQPTIDKIVHYFDNFDADIVSFFSTEVKELGVSGGCFEVGKISEDVPLGFFASIFSARPLNKEELNKVASELTYQLDETAWGPDGFFLDMSNGGYYLLPVHPDFNKAPILIEQNENV
jgi:hypothetical protein